MCLQWLPKWETALLSPAQIEEYHRVGAIVGAASSSHLSRIPPMARWCPSRVSSPACATCGDRRRRHHDGRHGGRERAADDRAGITSPPADRQGSIYENQKGMANRFFAVPEELRVKVVAS